MNEDKSKLELIGGIAQANNKNLELIEEINKLENNWNELKKWLEERYKDLEYANEYCIERDGCDNDYDINKMEVYEEMLKKMQELEGNNEQRNKRPYKR